MKQYIGRVERNSRNLDESLLHVCGGETLCLRRTGRYSLVKNKILIKLHGRTLVFTGWKMGAFLFVSSWRTLDYDGANNLMY